MRRIRIHSDNVSSFDERLRFLAIVFVSLFTIAVLRLAYWQIVKGSELLADAKAQHERKTSILAGRGSIYASDATPLSATTRYWRLIGNPQKNESARELSEKIVQKLPIDQENRELIKSEELRIAELLKKDELRWVVLKAKLSDEDKKRLEELDDEALSFEEEEGRIYPEASSAAQLIGFLGKDADGQNKGYFGLEGYYDVSLTGKSGFFERESDALGAPILFSRTRMLPAVSGIDLITHIEKPIQVILDQKLKEGIEKYGAKSGLAVIMRPRDGAILAMSSYPSFDPSKYWEYKNEDFLNPVVSSTFEPGSIFKVIVMASGIDARVVDPNTVCPICNGPVTISNYDIKTWNNEYRAGSTMTDVIVHSDNVGMVYVSKQLGQNRLLQYFEKFGIGQETGIDLQGEVPARMRLKKDWYEIDYATASFGQGIVVTPIQMIKAVGAIANKGVIVSPQVVDKFVQDDWEKDIEPAIGERVISESSAAKITGMMAEAAKNGEAKWTFLKGYRVAGKTGTAQIPIAGHYDAEKTIASFIGFAPYDNPEFVMLVTLQETTTSPWASETAAPLWYAIAKDLFLYFGIQPSE